jgi:hypothetical protein
MNSYKIIKFYNKRKLYLYMNMHVYIIHNSNIILNYYNAIRPTKDESINIER